MKIKLLIIGIGIIALSGLVYLFGDWLIFRMYKPTETQLDLGARLAEIKKGSDIELVVAGLNTPWEIGFMPNGDMLVTERSGVLRRISKTGQGTTYVIEEVKQEGEGGLLGLAIDPRFNCNGFLYVYLTEETDDGITNRVDRYTLIDDKLTDKTEIISGIPGSKYHNGGRIAFGPDEMLYITTGDAANGSWAQDTTKLAGKILRLNSDGSVPADNPFNNEVWSYGHRNPQGLAWDSEGTLWATEHGRSVPLSGMDELNKIERAGNYGWPLYEGDETEVGYIAPATNSGPQETWAPAGLAYWGGSLFFAGLRGETLYEAVLVDGEIVDLYAHFRSDYGRLRAVKVGPDGFLYVSTSNTDGRGARRSGDDRIIKINAGKLIGYKYLELN